MPAQHTVVFVLKDERWTIEIDEGQSLLHAAHACDAPVHTLCNGIGACVQCKVRIMEGEPNLSEPNNLEKDRLGNIFHLTHERLACQARVHGPVTAEALPIRRRPKDRRPIRRRR